MNLRVQRALDGDLAREQLGPQEAAEVRRMEALIGDVLRSVPGNSAPDLTWGLLSRIEGRAERSENLSSTHWWGKGTAWVWRQRPVSVMWRPIYAFAAIAALILTVSAPMSVPDRRSLVARAAPQVLVQFKLDAPQAKEVALAGAFTEWQPLYTMNRSTPGIWTVVVPLDPGIHEYAFIVDGHRWVPDPMAPAINDGFGGLNSRIAVLIPDRRRRL